MLLVQALRLRDVLRRLYTKARDLTWSPTADPHYAALRSDKQRAEMTVHWGQESRRAESAIQEIQLMLGVRHSSML